MFKTRLLSGILLLAIAFLTIISGGYVLFFTLLCVSLIGMQELYKAMKVGKKAFNLLEMAGYLCGVLYYCALLMDFERYGMMAVIMSLVILMFIYVFAYPKFEAGEVMAAFFGVIYVAVMLSYIYRTRVMEGGQLLVWLVFLSSWGCDTCAYCVGMLIGKHRMAPKLSPKKSVEGGIGGVVGAGILGAIYGAIFGGSMEAALHSPVVDCVIICMVGAVISQIGDLAASAIKRNHGVKDYGKLIPGHGGILDRFDSVIFVAPGIYYTIILLTEGVQALSRFLGA